MTKLSNKKITETNEFFELHAQMKLTNVDVTDWDENTLVQFRIGMHITREMRDWLIINLKYPGVGQDADINSWSCIDSYHQKYIRYQTWDGTKIIVDDYQNCYILDDKYGSTSVVHW